MKKIATCLLLLLLFGVSATAQAVKTMTGTVVKVGAEGNWGYIIIQVGNLEYGFEDEGNNFQIKRVGNIGDIGQTVIVFYKKIDCTHAYVEGVHCWLDATQIVEVKKTVAPRESRQSSAANNYIGFRHSVPLPSEFKEIGGWDDSWNQIDIAIREVSRDKVHMVWFDRLTHRDSSGQPYFEVKDVLLLPAMSPRQSLLYTRCHVGGQSRSEILAIAENQPQDRKFFGLVHRAWRVNLSRGKFEAISPNGMRCEKMIDRD